MPWRNPTTIDLLLQVVPQVIRGFAYLSRNGGMMRLRIMAFVNGRSNRRKQLRPIGLNNCLQCLGTTIHNAMWESLNHWPALEGSVAGSKSLCIPRPWRRHDETAIMAFVNGGANRRKKQRQIGLNNCLQSWGISYNIQVAILLT